VQYARHLGAHVVVTASGDDETRVRALGADEVVDYRGSDFAAVLSGFDVAIDSIGGTNLPKSLTVLRPGGLAISVVGPPDPAFAAQLGQPLLAPVMAALSWKVRRRARRLGVRYSFFFMHADGAALADIAELYDTGVLRPTLDRIYGFDQTPEALARVEQGQAKGKVVVSVSTP
jgi:NADPH:quinone reductase-like Zn-dependent oxidoreductase